MGIFAKFFIIANIITMKFGLTIPTIIMLFTACNGPSTGDEDTVKQDIISFAQAYFNYDFKHALKYCTPESDKWIKYAASNIHEADLELLREQDEGADVDLDDLEFSDNDSTGIAVVTVENYMRLDTIGNAGRMIDRATFRIPIVLRDTRWLIKMEDLPRSEKSSRD